MVPGGRLSVYSSQRPETDRTRTFLALHTLHARFRTLPGAFMSVAAQVVGENNALPSACTTSGANSMPNLSLSVKCWQQNFRLGAYI